MKRADQVFGHRLIYTPIASYVGAGALAWAAYALISGTVSLWWLLPLAVCTCLMLFGVTVGLHRLFCHASFRTSQFWHVVLAYLGTLAVYGSTIQWAGMHASHHQFSDTDKDPHYTGWRYLFWKKNRPTIFNRRVLVRLYRQPLHNWLHKYYIVPIVVTIASLWLLSPLALVFCYLAPLGWLHLVGSAHQVFAHDSRGAKDQPWLELVLFTGCEWEHRRHHLQQRSARFGYVDVGYQFIRLIRSR